MTFTTTDYLAAIQRELGKRAVTYPKIIAKKRKGGLPESEIGKMLIKMNIQNFRLDFAYSTIELYSTGDRLDHMEIPPESLYELIRELRERERCYPRWIRFGILDQTSADYELAVWRQMTEWYAREFLQLNELPPLRGYKKAFQSFSDQN